MAEHEFLTVGARRWCVNCKLFQSKRDGAWPDAFTNCPRTTPHAKAQDRGEKPKRGGPRADAEWGNRPRKER